MYRILLVFVFVSTLISNVVIGQNETKNNYFALGVETGLWLSDPGTFAGTKQASIGLRVDFFGKNKKGGSFTTGLSILTLGDHDNFLDITDSENITVSEDVRTYLKGSYRLKFFSIPLLYRYQQKWWYFSLGLEPYFKVNQKEMHSVADGITSDFLGVDFEDFDKDKVRSFNSTFNLSIALQVPMGPAWHFYIEPNYQILMSSVYKENIDDLNRNFFFLKLGLKTKIFLPNSGATK